MIQLAITTMAFGAICLVADHLTGTAFYQKLDIHQKTERYRR